MIERAPGSVRFLEQIQKPILELIKHA